MKPPIIFLAFSNSQIRYLEALKVESKKVYEILEPLEAENRYRIRREESINQEELIDGIRRYKDEIAIFHYSGHAGGKIVLLEDQTTHCESLGKLLNLSQKKIKLIFLNACNTYEAAEEFLRNGVNVVIATKFKVNDEMAQIFACEFYKFLVCGFSIKESFEATSHIIILKNSQYKSDIDYQVNFKSTETLIDKNKKDLPWLLLVNEGKEKELEWKLPTSQKSREPSGVKPTNSIFRKILESQIFPLLLITIPGALLGMLIENVNNVDTIKYVYQNKSVDARNNTLMIDVYIYSLEKEKVNATVQFLIKEEYRDSFSISHISFKKNKTEILREDVTIESDIREFDISLAPLERYVATAEVNYIIQSKQTNIKPIVFTICKVSENDKCDPGEEGLEIEDCIRLNLLAFGIAAYILLIIISWIVWRILKRKK